jgi:hypothetical protein
MHNSSPSIALMCCCFLIAPCAIRRSPPPLPYPTDDCSVLPPSSSQQSSHHRRLRRVPTAITVGTDDPEPTLHFYPPYLFSAHLTDTFSWSNASWFKQSVHDQKPLSAEASPASDFGHPLLPLPLQPRQKVRLAALSLQVMFPLLETPSSIRNMQCRCIVGEIWTSAASSQAGRNPSASDPLDLALINPLIESVRVDLSHSDQVWSNGPETESAQNGISQSKNSMWQSPWFKPDSNFVLKVRFGSKL